MTNTAKAKMMPGSNSGATYFAFAKKVGLVLGIKPYGITRGEMFHVPNTTYFMARPSMVFRYAHQDLDHLKDDVAMLWEEAQK